MIPMRCSLLKVWFLITMLCLFFFCLFFLQQARELVVKLIRDKDQGEFRVGRADFGSKMGGSSLDVRAFLLILDMLRYCDFIESRERIFLNL